jgi:hypothetical protein
MGAGEVRPGVNVRNERVREVRRIGRELGHDLAPKKRSSRACGKSQEREAILHPTDQAGEQGQAYQIREPSRDGLD